MLSYLIIILVGANFTIFHFNEQLQFNFYNHFASDSQIKLETIGMELVNTIQNRHGNKINVELIEM